MSKTATAPELYCPHLQEVDNQTLQQLFSKVAAVRSQNRELFDFTHRRIEVFQESAGEIETVSEEEVYDQFDEDKLKNFAVVIEGEVGTGKSELCAYLSHRLKDDGRPILHVDKEDDLMSLLSERLPEFYHEQFGEEMEGAADFKRLRDDIESVPQVVANSAVSNSILNLRQRGYDVGVTEKQENKISEFIRDKLRLFVERGKYATEIKFVTEQEYRQNEFLQIFTDTSIDEAVEKYNEEIWRVVRERYETASLSSVLKSIGSEFTDTRPVIVFEDFSITAMEANKLASFIESDSTENTWDFIIAGTRDSTDPLHTQTAESRYEFYQTNKGDQGVLFLDQDSAVDFVRPYLGYFKSLDDSVQYEREDGTFKLKPAPSGTRCDQCGLCDEEFRDLFPFNEHFLKRIFIGMEEHQGTPSPREYIMTVFDVLSAYYEGKITVPSNAKSLQPLVNRIGVADAVYEDAEDFGRLARWYGIPDDNNEMVIVDRRFAKAFGLVDSGDGTADLPGPVEARVDEIRIPTSDIDISSSPERASDDDNDSENDGDSSKSISQTDPVEEEFKEQAPLIESWRNAPRDYKRTAQYLERGLEDAVEKLTDGHILYEGTSLEYNLSSQKRPFVFSITEDTPDDDQIVIDPNEFRLSELRSVLRFGIERDKNPRNAGYDELLSTTGTQLTGYAKEWRAQIRNTNLESSNALYTKHSQYDFTDFILAAYSYVIVLDSPWKPLSAETLCDRFGDGEYAIDSDIRTWLDSELEHSQVRALKRLVENASHLEEMVGELFGISGSNLDQYQISQWLNHQTPHTVLGGLGRTYIKNVDNRVRFKDGTKIRELADTAYDARRGLEEISSRYQQDTVDDIESNLSDISMDEFDRIVSKLGTYEVDPDVMEPLKQFNQLEQSDIDAVVEAAKAANSLYSPSTFKSIRAVLASIKLDNSTVYERYQAVPLRSTNGSQDIGYEFKEVAQYYAE
ncbi:ATP-binding protein [Natranaeroarchaeum sulfidigenes]|uniref:Uncharacterized protein n=1 Tax=Natranaeroarchaeum sulfidigenes TaxID=2784880 RepID=A0A897MUT9_9EURY|nr:ATP-binding protein [Natranaeroarchaeum sulfidigenes]QSG02813.1 hypothetical protein AArcS_1602 [Natranaeroarchaeum sulfidigenes]